VLEFQLQAALEGDLEGFQRGTSLAWLQAGRKTMEIMERKGLDILRGSVVEAGLGQQLANTWQADIYPARGLSYNPAIVFYSKAPEIIGAHQGETIRASGGTWLAIPIPGSPAEDFPTRGMTRVEYARQKFGDRLFSIPARGGRLSILAVENVSLTKTGRVSVRQKTKTGKYGKNAATLFLFWLVPQVTLDARLDVQADFRQVGQMFANEFERIFGEQLLQAGLGQ